jgi:uncharacterized membrane protein YgaE (UPF0421/DUF939 family)
MSRNNNRKKHGLRSFLEKALAFSIARLISSAVVVLANPMAWVAFATVAIVILFVVARVEGGGPTDFLQP